MHINDCSTNTWDGPQNAPKQKAVVYVTWTMRLELCTRPEPSLRLCPLSGPKEADMLKLCIPKKIF